MCVILKDDIKKEFDKEFDKQLIARKVLGKYEN
jgi:hypothetical protein